MDDSVNYLIAAFAPVVIALIYYGVKELFKNSGSNKKEINTEKIVITKKTTNIGIGSSVLIIATSLVTAISPDIIWSLHNSLVEIIYSLIVTTLMVGFFYSISKYFETYGKHTLTKILYLLIILEIIEFVTYVIYREINLPVIVNRISSFFFIPVFIIFGIQVLRIREKGFLKYWYLQAYVIFQLVVFAVVLVAIILGPELSYSHIINTISIISYIFGMLFFINLSKQQTLNNA